MNHLELAARLGFASADDLFEVVGKDEFRCATSSCCCPAEPACRLTPMFAAVSKTQPGRQRRVAGGGRRLAADAAGALLQARRRRTRSTASSRAGKGVSVHRADCSNREMVAVKRRPRHRGRLGHPKGRQRALPGGRGLQAADRQGLLRDISEVIRQEKMNVTGVQTQSIKGTAWMTFTVEIRLRVGCSTCWDWWGLRGVRRRGALSPEGMSHSVALTSM